MSEKGDLLYIVNIADLWSIVCQYLRSFELLVSRLVCNTMRESVVIECYAHYSYERIGYPFGSLERTIPKKASRVMGAIPVASLPKPRVVIRRVFGSQQFNPTSIYEMPVCGALYEYYDWFQSNRRILVFNKGDLLQVHGYIMALLVFESCTSKGFRLSSTGIHQCNDSIQINTVLTCLSRSFRDITCDDLLIQYKDSYNNAPNRARLLIIVNPSWYIIDLPCPLAAI